jgi:hypothetical protein
MKRLFLLGAAVLAISVSPAAASTVSFTFPSVVNGPFDVVVKAQNLFTGRDTTTDIIISYGFNVTVGDPSIVSFLSATSGPLFDPATSEPGTRVFAAASGQHGFGIEPGVVEPLTLATLHFSVLRSGTANILISSDLSNPFQGLQFLNAPFQEPIAGTISATATATAPVPEPGALLLSGISLLAGSLWRFKRKVDRAGLSLSGLTASPPARGDAALRTSRKGRGARSA